MATIFFSDVHCGDDKSKHAELLAYLRKYKKSVDKIIIVGDLLDLWVSSLGKALPTASPLLEFIKKNYEGNFHYILGNHDWDLLPLKPLLPFIHTSLLFNAYDKKVIVLHGHLLDPDPYVKTKFSHYMAWFINKFDRWAKIDTRKALVSLSERIKNDPYEKLLKAYEENIVTMAKGNFDFVIVGHSHQPSIKTIDGVVIINCGDQMQHSTVVIANRDGFFLFDYIAQKTLDFYRIQAQ